MYSPKDVTTFFSGVRQTETDGNKLSFIEDNDNIVATEGYRVYSNLFMGNPLYVDKLAFFRKRSLAEL